jgi:hypothetical protein
VRGCLITGDEGCSDRGPFIGSSEALCASHTARVLRPERCVRRDHVPKAPPEDHGQDLLCRDGPSGHTREEARRGSHPGDPQGRAEIQTLRVKEGAWRRSSGVKSGLTGTYPPSTEFVLIDQKGRWHPRMVALRQASP